MANTRMDYAWGSPTAIPAFLGEEPDGGPVAELWIGAHSKAPSVLLDFDGDDVPLDRALREHQELLGEDAASRFGGLPFLVKLLAAGSPLSLQVHPSAETAREGFAREDAAGTAPDAVHRTYKDPHHKPETMIALAPTETLVGFRAANDAQELLTRLDLPWADAVAERLDEADMAPAFAVLLDQGHWTEAREAVLARCRALGEERPFALVLELDAAFPDDSGAAAPLLLNIAQYDVGQALFVPTGQVHAHVSGFGIEVMAASDNVIRAGLTSKFVDVEALFGSLVTTPSAPGLVAAGERMRFPVSEFAVATLGEGDAVAGSGPRILLAHDGPCTVGELDLQQGQSVFIADGEFPRLGSGRATVVHVA